MFKIKFLLSYFIIFLSPLLGADSKDLSSREDLQTFVGSYINSALELNCWGAGKKISDIIRVEKYEKSYKQKPEEGYGRIIFLQENEKANPDDFNNIYVRILEEGGGTSVRKNVLTFILKDLFSEESVDLYLKNNDILLLKEKDSQKTGLFWEIDENKKKQWFAKRYHDAQYPYTVNYVVAHELIHLMQNKKGDYDKLTKFSVTPTEQTIMDNLDLLKKYKSSFAQYIPDIDNVLYIIELIQQKKEIGREDLNNLGLIEELNKEIRKGTPSKEAVSHIIRHAFATHIRRIQYMEKLIEESALLGSQWGEDSINEWRILYANNMPVRYPYTAKTLEVFRLDEDVIEGMFQSALNISSQEYPHQASLEEEERKMKQQQETQLENPFNESTDESQAREVLQRKQKVDARMFQKMIDRERKKKEFSHLSENDIAAEIIKDGDSRHKILYEAWKTLK